MAIHEMSISELADGLRQRKFSSLELTQHFLHRISEHDRQLNAFVSLCPESALAAAEAADVRLRLGQGGSLTGIPIAHKDIFCTQGVKTSCGSRMLDNFIAPYDATVVERLSVGSDPSLGQDLRRCLGGLKEEHRRCVVMAYHYGLSYEELSALAAVPLGTVKSWIHRAIGQLQICLSQ